MWKIRHNQADHRDSILLIFLIFGFFTEIIEAGQNDSSHQVCGNWAITNTMNGEQFVPLTLTEIRNGKRPVGRPIRILCEGVFDLFHIGHVEVLRQAKCALPDAVVVSGVNTDEEVLQVKDHLPVMTFQERLQALKTCRYVDEVIEDLPYFYTIDFLNRHQIDLVAHDDLPYIPNVLGENSPMFNFYDKFKKVDRFVATQRTEGISTTDLIQRIVRMYKGHAFDSLLPDDLKQNLNP